MAAAASVVAVNSTMHTNKGEELVKRIGNSN